MLPGELKAGAIYFGVAYEDEEFMRPILHTYEYLGMSGDRDAPYLFRFVGSDDTLQMAEQNLELIVDAAGLIELLGRFRDGMPMHSRPAS